MPSTPHHPDPASGQPAGKTTPPPFEPSSAEDGTSADLILTEDWSVTRRPAADTAETVGGTRLGVEHDRTDHEAWRETPGGTLLEPVVGDPEPDPS
jgi:hypothetical protein